MGDLSSYATEQEFKTSSLSFFLLSFLPSFLPLFFFSATPEPYGGSQARGQILAIAAGLHHSRSNTRSEPHL